MNLAEWLYEARRLLYVFLDLTNCARRQKHSYHIGVHLYRSITHLPILCFTVTPSKIKMKEDKYCVLSHDVMAAILVSQNNETKAMFVPQTSLVGVELSSYVNAFVCSNKFA